MKKLVFLVFIFLFVASSYKCEKQNADSFILVKNINGPTLGYSPSSGVNILTVGGLKFKDLNKNGKLDRYEDWRVPTNERAKDLASKMTIDQIAGLMLYSMHQAIPAPASGFMAGTYHGKIFKMSRENAWDLTDQQKEFLQKDKLRNVLITTVKSPAAAARWNNAAQAFVEGTGLGIPVNISSDPRNMVTANTQYTAGAGGTISMWPYGLGMAATFDPSLNQQFGHIAAQEYRALGITTALSPQIGLGTEPRWRRINGSFGESPKLARDMARAYIDGFQTSYGKDEIKNGWGYKSINAMAKHWPGGGTGEGGRDAHYCYGKYAVYPGDNLKEQLIPFVDGAFKLNEATRKVAAVMPYYTISYNQDKKYGENVGNNFSKYLITDLLRTKYGYDGVVCTDWMIMPDEGKTPDTFFSGKCWGVEQLSVAERHYKAIEAGIDQFGGDSNKKAVLEAYNIGVKKHGETFMQNRFRQSAVRILQTIFRIGLFENPYLNPEESEKLVGNPEFMEAGYKAQLKSVVLLKNHKSVLPVRKRETVYIPKIYTPAMDGWLGSMTQPEFKYPVDTSLVKKYYNLTADPSKADFAIVFVTSPESRENGYRLEDRQNGGNGYLPITLQYKSYTAINAREHSIAAGDPIVEPGISNRSYKNKTVVAANTMDLNTILDTKKMMNGKPVIVSVTASNPMVFGEFEPEVDAIVLNFGVSAQAQMDIISGKAEPSGLLPVQMPADMKTVEQQKEDVPFDMKCYQDSEGHIYDFGYGLNWEGPIKDSRVAQYVKKNL